MSDSKARRGGGRQARLALRAAGPQFAPAPPGARGGLYRPLDDGQMDRIISAAFRLLAELGMGEGY